MQSEKKKKKKKKKICTVKPNAVTVFGTISLFQYHFIYFLAATEQLYNSLCLSVGQTFSHDDVNRIEAKPLKVESSDLKCSLI